MPARWRAARSGQPPDPCTMRISYELLEQCTALQDAGQLYDMVVANTASSILLAALCCSWPGLHAESQRS